MTKLLVIFKRLPLILLALLAIQKAHARGKASEAPQFIDPTGFYMPPPGEPELIPDVVRKCDQEIIKEVVSNETKARFQAMAQCEYSQNNVDDSIRKSFGLKDEDSKTLHAVAAAYVALKDDEIPREKKAEIKALKGMAEAFSNPKDLTKLTPKQLKVFQKARLAIQRVQPYAEAYMNTQRNPGLGPEFGDHSQGIAEAEMMRAINIALSDIPMLMMDRQNFLKDVLSAADKSTGDKPIDFMSFFPDEKVAVLLRNGSSSSVKAISEQLDDFLEKRKKLQSGEADLDDVVALAREVLFLPDSKMSVNDRAKHLFGDQVNDPKARYWMLRDGLCYLQKQALAKRRGEAIEGIITAPFDAVVMAATIWGGPILAAGATGIMALTSATGAHKAFEADSACVKRATRNGAISSAQLALAAQTPFGEIDENLSPAQEAVAEVNECEKQAALGKVMAMGDLATFGAMGAHSALSAGLKVQGALAKGVGKAARYGFLGLAAAGQAQAIPNLIQLCTGDVYFDYCGPALAHEISSVVAITTAEGHTKMLRGKQIENLTQELKAAGAKDVVFDPGNGKKLRGKVVFDNEGNPSVIQAEVLDEKGVRIGTEAYGLSKDDLESGHVSQTSAKLPNRTTTKLHRWLKFKTETGESRMGQVLSITGASANPEITVLEVSPDGSRNQRKLTENELRQARRANKPGEVSSFLAQAEKKAEQAKIKGSIGRPSRTSTALAIAAAIAVGGTAAEARTTSATMPTEITATLKPEVLKISRSQFKTDSDFTQAIANAQGGARSLASSKVSGDSLLKPLAEYVAVGSQAENVGPVELGAAMKVLSQRFSKMGIKKAEDLPDVLKVELARASDTGVKPNFLADIVKKYRDCTAGKCATGACF